LIDIRVTTPVKLNKRQEELLREFAEIENGKKSSQKPFADWFDTFSQQTYLSWVPSSNVRMSLLMR